MSLLPNGSIAFGEYIVQPKPGGVFQACYYAEPPNPKVFWQDYENFVVPIPYFTTQLSVMILVIRFFFLVFSFAPPFFAELLSALALGPILAGQSQNVSKYVHPLKQTKVLETMANFGILYYMFLVGLEMDLTRVRQIRKKAVDNAMAGILIPICMGASLYFLLTHLNKIDKKNPLGALFWAIALTVTSFPDLARVLSDVKLLHTDIGRLALSSAFINELVSWALLVGTITIYNSHDAFWILPMLGFMLLCWFVARPALAWTISKTSTGGKYKAHHIYFILSGVVVCGFITDACGSHSLIGAFMFGLIIPSGELAMKLMETLEDFVPGILIPAFFMVTGNRCNVIGLTTGVSTFMLIVIIVLACLAKIISTYLISTVYGIPAREGLALGALMNTKGILALIIIDVGRGLGALDNQTYTIMVFVFLIMTMFVKPIPKWACKGSKSLKQYKHRTLERSKANSELRILVGIHSTRNVNSMISLLKLSNSSKESPICVFAVHLVELKGRLSAMLIVHDSHKRNGSQHHISQEGKESEQIISTFERFESNSQGVSVQPLTAVSPYATMHEDICSLAEDKRVTLILVPFHKLPNADGVLQDENSCIRKVNQNLLTRAPCSVGIFIDRGLGSDVFKMSNQDDAGSRQRHFTMFFLGGPDDREALAYATRLAKSQLVTLTVVRFLPGEATIDDEKLLENSTPTIEGDEERQLDNEFVNEFRFKTMSDQSITSIDKVVNTGEEMLQTIRNLFGDYDLYIVGRGECGQSPLTFGLSEWSEYEELGALGDALSTSDFAQSASVLVIQQYKVAVTDSRRSSVAPPLKERIGTASWQSPMNRDFEPFISSRKFTIDYDDDDDDDE